MFPQKQAAQIANAIKLEAPPPEARPAGSSQKLNPSPLERRPAPDPRSPTADASREEAGRPHPEAARWLRSFESDVPAPTASLNPDPGRKSARAPREAARHAA